MMTQPVDIEAGRALVEGMTGGEWTTRDSKPTGDPTEAGDVGIVCDNAVLGEAFKMCPRGRLTDRTAFYADAQANATGIAWLRNNATAMLDGLARLRAERQWVDVKEGLPNHGDRVLFIEASGTCSVAAYYSTNGWLADNGWRPSPVYWRPLPPLPEAPR